MKLFAVICGRWRRVKIMAFFCCFYSDEVKIVGGSEDVIYDMRGKSLICYIWNIQLQLQFNVTWFSNNSKITHQTQNTSCYLMYDKCLRISFLHTNPCLKHQNILFDIKAKRLLVNMFPIRQLNMLNYLFYKVIKDFLLKSQCRINCWNICPLCSVYCVGTAG